MKKFLVIMMTAVLALSVFVGCSAASAGKIYGKEDTDIVVNKDDIFTIQLEENPTTGYAWTVSVSDESTVKLIDDQYTAESKDQNIVGGGGVHEFTFQALSAGTTQITFVYERSFEENSAVETIVYNVTLK